jgi:hypothetical protein
MAEIINLRRARKQRDRAASEAQAAANRAVHGRTKGEKEKALIDQRRREQSLDGAKLERD